MDPRIFGLPLPEPLSTPVLDVTDQFLFFVSADIAG
jgi:hypothetical protein